MKFGGNGWENRFDEERRAGHRARVIMVNHIQARNRRSRWILSLGCLLSVFWVASPAVGAEGASLVVMTYNLRYASATPPNAWPDRRPLVAELIQKVAPDLIGTQEGVYGQLKDLAADLPDYEWIGLGRDGGSRGEFMAIFYRSSRFEPVAFDHFWLSDTPTVVGSSTWGNSNRRMVTWVRFRDRPSGREFYLFNTHFDHEIQAAREKSAALLRERIQALNTDLPVLVTGDFNAGADNRTYAILTEGEFLKDTWVAATVRRNAEVGTFNGFREMPVGKSRIDWILSRGKVRVEATEIETFARGGQFPSDHFPVIAWLRLED